MKKRLSLFSGMLILCAGILVAQSIKVTQPASGDVWNQGKTYQITWTKSGNMPNSVRISLKESNSATIVLTIASDAPNSGAYSWLVPESVAPGQYKVRVKVKNVDVRDDSAAFTIAGAVETPTIVVTKPAAGETWVKNSTHNVTWTKSGSLPTTVAISLLNKTGTSLVRSLAANAPNSGSFTWTIPSDIAANDYRIRVRASGTSVQDNSDIFTIKAEMQESPGGFREAQKIKSQLQLDPSRQPQKLLKVVEKKGIYLNWAWNKSWTNIAPPPEVYAARPSGCPEATANQYAKVGYDHFYAQWDRGGTPFADWVAKLYRSKIRFALSDLAAEKDKLIKAEIKFHQVDSVRTNTNYVSCGTGLFILTGEWTDWEHPPITSPLGLLYMHADYDLDITDTVKQWLDGSLQNFGLLINSNKEWWVKQAITCMSCFEVTLVLSFSQD
jgi:hypothetical protein